MVRRLCPHCGGNLVNEVACPHCGQSLKDVAVRYVERKRLKDEPAWRRVYFADSDKSQATRTTSATPQLRLTLQELLRHFRSADLARALRELGLPVSGTKEERKARLMDAAESLEQPASKVLRAFQASDLERVCAGLGVPGKSKGEMLAQLYMIVQGTRVWNKRQLAAESGQPEGLHNPEKLRLPSEHRVSSTGPSLANSRPPHASQEGQHSRLRAAIVVIGAVIGGIVGVTVVTGFDVPKGWALAGYVAGGAAGYALTPGGWESTKGFIRVARIPLALIGAVAGVNGAIFLAGSIPFVQSTWAFVPLMIVGALLFLFNLAGRSADSESDRLGRTLFLAGIVMFFVGCSVIFVQGSKDKVYPEWYDGCKPGRC